MSQGSSVLLHFHVALQWVEEEDEKDNASNGASGENGHQHVHQVPFHLHLRFDCLPVTVLATTLWRGGVEGHVACGVEG